MKEEHALIAGELSGHIMFGENYYGFDDALYAACLLISIVARCGPAALGAPRGAAAVRLHLRAALPGHGGGEVRRWWSAR